MADGGVGQPAIPTENFMVLEENGHVRGFKMSAAVMEAKPKHIRHTVLTKDRMRVEDMPTYIQQFAHEGQFRDLKPGRTNSDMSCTTADTRKPNSYTQLMPKERQALHKDCNTSGTKYAECEVPSMRSRKAISMSSFERSYVRFGSTHEEDNFEYRIRQDIVPTNDAYMMPPITMASGVVPRMEAVAGCTTVRFCQVGVTKAFLPAPRILEKAFE
jgi:hypothetical protein